MTPTYVISASVPRGNRVRQFYSDDPKAARFLLMNAEQLRYAGFDLRMNAVPENGPDGSWEVKSGKRKGLRLYQDGTVIFRAAADESFLGWGVEPETFLAFPRLNPVAVVEIHAGFVLLYGRILQRLQQMPTEVLFDLTLKNVVVGSQRLLMTRHFNGPAWRAIDLPRFVAERDPANEQLKVPAEQLIAKPWAVAFQLVERFALIFDMPTDQIPFVKDVGGTKEIDVEALKAV